MIVSLSSYDTSNESATTFIHMEIASTAISVGQAALTLRRLNIVIVELSERESEY